MWLVAMCYAKFWLYFSNSRSLVNICLRPHNESQVGHPQYWLQISPETLWTLRGVSVCTLFMKSTSPEFIKNVLVGRLSSCLDYKQEMPVIEKKIYPIKKHARKNIKKLPSWMFSVLCLGLASRWYILWDALEHVWAVWCSLNEFCAAD